MEEVVLASANKHKIEEIYEILKDFDYKILSLDEVGLGDLDIVEDGDTFEANSLIKAKTVFEKTGKPSIGDDSGLMVDCLNGEPGVFSARYSGEDKNYKANNDKLIENLRGVPKEKRTAKFVTVITMILSEEDILVARGEVCGWIAESPRGTNGFGYDPLFVVPELDKTFAELGAQEKNGMSHRANALVKLKALLEARK